MNASDNDKKILKKIPDIFHSDALEGPFRKCLNCEKDLYDPPQHYLIEKAVKRYKDFETTDTIFEYAICLKCHQEFMSAYSEESLKNIQNYFDQTVNFEQRRTLMAQQMQNESFNIQEWLSRCVVKGTHIKRLSEYQVGCQCYGDKMIVQSMPFLIGNAAMDEIAQLLSNKTIDKMDGFIDEFFGLPPDLRKLIKDSGVLIL